jgi:hypothetical protein|tara:strand:+ start:245 stop:442 length:198 start_codon:yes stop_codon:yes gene_type:complete
MELFIISATDLAVDNLYFLSIYLLFSQFTKKIIINKAIASKGFPKELFGHNLEQIEYLLTLCIVF